jgi:hypothetical protein
VAGRPRAVRRTNGGAVRPAREGAPHGRGCIKRGAAHRPAVVGPPRHARMVAYVGEPTWHRRRRGRAFAFQRLVQFGLGNFDHDFLPNFELKCTEE